MTEVLLVQGELFAGIARVPELFARAGCRVSALTVRGSVLECSSWVAERSPAGATPDETLELLRRRIQARPVDWVVLGDDTILARAVMRRAEPWIAKLLPVAEGVDALPLISKVAFSAAMSRIGVPMSPSRPASGRAAVEKAARELGLPVIIKPENGSAGVGIVSARSEPELAAALERVTGDYLVEGLVDGEVGSTAMLFMKGRPVWWCSFVKRGVYPPPFGPSCRRKLFEPPGLEPVIERIGAALGLHGMFGLDWILSKDGRFFVLELNGRPVSTIPMARQVREAFPAALRDMLAGRYSPRRPDRSADERVFHSMPNSFSLALRERRPLEAAALALGLGGPTDVPWSDSGLLRHYSVRMAKAVLKAPLTLLRGGRK